MKKGLTATFAAICLWPVVARGGEHPEVLNPQSRGYEWVAASWALEADGSVKTHVPILLQEQLELQMRWFESRFGSAREHGLVEGQVVEDRFCPRDMIQFGAPEDHGRFDAALLLSEVAVIATVEEVILGFGPRAYPTALLALSDVEPLHDRALTPRYAMVPLGWLVLRDRVFCGGYGNGKFQPRVGARIVVVGNWGDSAVVSLHPARAGSLAVVEADGTLRWKWHDDTGPSTLVRLQRRVDEVVTSEIFEAASGLRAAWREFEDREARRAFGKTWDGLRRLGCQTVGASASSDGTLGLSCSEEAAP